MSERVASWCRSSSTTRVTHAPTCRTAFEKCSGHACPQVRRPGLCCARPASAVAGARDHDPGARECPSRSRRDYPGTGAGILVAKAWPTRSSGRGGLRGGDLHRHRQLWISKTGVSSLTVAVSAAPAAFRPPPHSLAVLPFVNMSGDPSQEYFSDGLTEELLNSLTVSTSCRSRRGRRPSRSRGRMRHRHHRTKLNVAAVLEGSVRRSAQPYNYGPAHQYSDRVPHMVADLDRNSAMSCATDRNCNGGCERPQSRAAGERSTPKSNWGHLRVDAAAFDAYLRGSKAARSGEGASSYQNAIAEYTEAIRLDPNYALAFAGRSLVLSYYAGEFANGTGIREFAAKARPMRPGA